MIAVGLSGGTVNVYDYREGSLAYVISPAEEDQLVRGSTPIKANSRCLRWADIYLGQSPQTSLFGAHVRIRSARIDAEGCCCCSRVS